MAGKGKKNRTGAEKQKKRALRKKMKKAFKSLVDEDSDTESSNASSSDSDPRFFMFEKMVCVSLVSNLICIFAFTQRQQLFM